MIILILIICAAAIGVYFLLPLFGGGHQVFTDIIIENVSGSGYDKSGELRLFWLILAAGALFLVLALHLYTLLRRKRLTTDFSSEQNVVPITRIKDHRLPLFGGILLFPFLSYLLVFGQFSLPLFAGILIFALCNILCPKLTGQVLLTYTLTYYGLMALLTLLVQFTDAAALSSVTIYMLTLIFGTLFSSIMTTQFRRNTGTAFGRRLLLVLQCMLPGLICLWFVDDYFYKGQLIHVPYAPGYMVFFGGFMGIALILLIIQAVRFWNKNEKYIIGAITPILIFSYHSFSAAPMYAQPDQHHHGEQMIPWNQIFLHGQSLYEEYTPVSGLFPFVNGFIQHVLLGGTVTDYSPAISITIVIFCIITMYLIYKHVGGGYATAFAVLFTLPVYNRQYMVLPVLLLLSLPGLLKKNFLWLHVWIYACFLSGLYYPLYGAALLLGTLPLGIWQLVAYIKSDNFKKDLKKPAFYISNVILLLIITHAFPLLLRMLRHTMTYSSQTIMADGINLLGQKAPQAFLPYLASHDFFRQACYISFRFLLPAIGVWIFVYFIYRALAVWRNTKLALLLASGAITLMVSYSYTLVRADLDKILSRTATVLIAVLAMYLPVLLFHYGKGLKGRLSLVVLTGVCSALPMMVFMQTSWSKFPDIWVYPDGSSQLVMDDSSKLYSYYEVPESFLKSEDTGLAPKYQALLGRGFMVADQISYITDYASVIEKCQAVEGYDSYMAFDGQGFFDYLGVKCSGTGYIPAARSYEAQKEIWNAASRELPVVFYIQPYNNYYIFRFMLDEGYLYCARDAAFYPPGLYTALYGNAKGDDYRSDTESSNFGLSAESFGASLDTLQDIFVADASKSQSDGSLPSDFSGMEYDFIYLELDEKFMEKAALPDASHLIITWSDREGNSFDGNYVECQIKEGKLLIPMGMNACWLLSDMDDFTLTITAPDNGPALYETTYKRLNASEEDSAFIKELTLMRLNIKR